MHEMQADHQGKTQVLEHKGLWRRCVVFLQAKFLFLDGRDVATFVRMWHKCATIFFRVSRHFDSLNGRKSMAKPRIRAVCCFRRISGSGSAAVKERGFRSEQAFLLPLASTRFGRGDNTEAVTQFEARVAATLTNLAKQVQGLQTLAHAQVALTDVFLKYVITCVVEPPEDALPAARVRARLRYEKLVRAAAEEISNKNRDTLKGMVADE